MTTITGLRVASMALGLAALGSFTADAALSPDTRQLAEAAVEQQAAIVEIVSPTRGAAVGTILFGIGGEENDGGLRFGGPR